MIVARAWPLAILFAALGIASAAPERAPIESARWTTHGPVTGGFLRLEIDGGRHTTLYSLTPYQGLLRSDDGGDHWNSINLSEPAPSRFGGFGAAPGASGILYAYIGNAVYRSADSGDSWTPAGDVPVGGGVEGLVVDPVHSATLYSSTVRPSRGLSTGYLYKSVDAGRSWALLPLSGSSLRRLIIDPRNPSFLYAAPGQGYPIERSGDGGQRWSPIVPRGLAGAFDVAADPGNYDTVYAAYGEGGLFVSHDRGDTWTSVNAPPGFAVVALAVDPLQPQRIYAGTLGSGSGLYRSDNGGETWVLLSFSMAGVSVIDPVDPQVLYASGLKSVDGGATWRTLPTGDIASLITSLVRSSSGTVYAAGLGDRRLPAVFRSDDEGTSWVTQRTGLTTGGDLSSIVVDPANANRLFVGVSGLDRTVSPGLFESETGGVVWFPVGDGLPDFGVLGLVINPLQSRTMYARTFSGVYRSDDGGRGWRAATAGITTSVSSLAIDPTDPARLYASGSRELFRTFDGGATWMDTPVVVTNSPDPSQNYLSSLAVDPVRPWILFALSPLGVVRSVDAGQTWAIVAVADVSTQDFTALAIDPAHPTNIYIGSRFGRILHSSDGGDSWRFFDRGFPPVQVQVLLVDRANSTLHAGTSGRGVWEILIPADRWKPRILSPR